MTTVAPPVSAADLTSESLTELVRTRFPTAAVRGFHVLSAHEFGDGDVSTAGRITIQIDDCSDERIPRRLVLKIARPDLGALPLYANEVSFFSKLRPELSIETPQCYGTMIEPRSGAFAIALEDLRTRKAAFANAETKLSLGQARSILAQAARLHAIYWESPRFDADMAWVEPHTSGEIHTLFTHPDLVPAMIRQQVDQVPFKAEILASIGQSADDLYRQVVRLQDHQARLPRTLVHGDLHVGNTYYLPDGSGGFVDWQLTAHGHFMHDVAYYIVTALRPDVRRDNERKLIEHYLEQLALSGVVTCSFEEAWMEYRRSVVWGLYIGWLITPLENYGWSINVVNHLRLATAYRDLDAASALRDLPA